jgi:hypothetical protein
MAARGAGVESDPIEIDLDDSLAPLTSAAGSCPAAAAPVAPAASATAPPKGKRILKRKHGAAQAPPTAPGAHDAGIDYGEITAEIAADNLAAHIAAKADQEMAPAPSTSKAGAAPTLDPAADDFGDDEEGQFSDIEPPAPAPVVRPSSSGPVDDADFDFSGSVAAVRQRCPLCDKPLALSWNEQRGRLEHTVAAKLRSTVYHLECILIRRGPGEDQPAQMQGSRRSCATDGSL